MTSLQIFQKQMKSVSSPPSTPCDDINRNSFNFQSTTLSTCILLKGSCNKFHIPPPHGVFESFSHMASLFWQCHYSQQEWACVLKFSSHKHISLANFFGFACWHLTEAQSESQSHWSQWLPLCLVPTVISALVTFFPSSCMAHSVEVELVFSAPFILFRQNVRLIPDFLTLRQ